MPKIKVTKEEWLELGIDLFSEHGIKGINVERMSAQLKCNKSSFYWHFKSKERFIEAIVAAWMKGGTNDIILNINQYTNPKEQLLQLLRQSFGARHHKDFMFHLRKLATTNQIIGEQVAATEQRRMQFTSGLIRAMGYPEEEAMEKGELIYFFYLGWYELHKNQPFTEEDYHKIVRQINHIIK